MQQAEINLIVALAGLIIAITPALVAIVYAQSIAFSRVWNNVWNNKSQALLE